MGTTTRGASVLGIDIGGTKLALASVDPRGAVLHRSVVGAPAFDAGRMVESILELVAGGIASSRAEGLEVEAVGIGAAGFILWEEGLLMSSPNIDWSDVPLRDIVARSTGLPTFLDNDATAAASGERLAGIAKGIEDFVLVTLGTGIGGGICIGGRVLRGSRGTAAEVGHMVLDPEGPECGCGRRGCLEALASGTALEREAVRLAGADPSSVLHDASTSDPGSVTGEMVSAAARGGDAAAAAAFENISWHLGLGIANLVHLLDPRMVVLGGGVSRSGDLFIDRVRDTVAARGVPELVRDVRVELSTLGSEAGVIGAAAVAWEGIGGPPSK